MLQGTENGQGQISVYIFKAKWRLLCLYCPSNIFTRGSSLEDLFSKLFFKMLK